MIVDHFFTSYLLAVLEPNTRITGLTAEIAAVGYLAHGIPGDWRAAATAVPCRGICGHLLQIGRINEFGIERQILLEMSRRDDSRSVVKGRSCHSFMPVLFELS